jgi:predicted homoserine dehydrogenase-like protein
VVIAPLAGPVVDVIAMAKRNLSAGETIDGLGGFMTYGVCETTVETVRGRHLLMGLAEGCRLKRNVAKDAAITLDDVDVPNSLARSLRSEQDAIFPIA